jgi:hypothetical protein
MKQPRFKEGDEVVLTYEGKHPIESEDYAASNNIRRFTPCVVSESKIASKIFSSKPELYDTIYIKDASEHIGHPAVKFRKVERIKLQPISTDKLKRGDIVKFNDRDKAKFAVAYMTKDIVFFYSTTDNHPFVGSDELIPMMRFYSVIVYKLLNVKDLCK